MKAIEANTITKQYKNGVQALKGLSLHVEEGQIFSLLGPNGAGKSTLIQVLTTFLKPDSGSVTMLGKNLEKDAGSVRRQIACVSQRTSIDSYLSLKENMLFQSRLYKIPPAKAKERMDTLIACFGLERYLHYPVSSYSGGVKRRLDIALNMMSNPQILFLDEPTVGMDVTSRKPMWDMMKKIREDFGTTVFLTTHYLEEAETLSDSVCIIKEGREILQDSPQALRELLHKNILRITFTEKETARQAASEIAAFLGFPDIQQKEYSLITDTLNHSGVFQKTIRFLMEKNIPFTGIEISQPSLEDVFLRLTEEGGKSI